MSELRLKPHQWEALDKIYTGDTRRLIINAATGSGKTILGLALSKLYHVRRTLIVTIPVLINNAWLLDNERFDEFNLPITHITSKNIEAIQGEGIFIASYAIIMRLADAFQAVKWDCVILDESQKVCNRGSETAKAIVGRVRMGEIVGGLDTDRAYMMTGTFIPNREEQAYPQLVMAGLRLTWTQFKSRFFFNPSPNHPYFVMFLEYMRPDFNDLIAHYSIAVSKKDAGITAKKQEPEILTYKPSAKMLKIQSELKNHSVYEDKNMTVTIDYNIVKFLRYRELASGFIRDNEGKVHEVASEPYDIFESFMYPLATEDSIIVFYTFNYERDRLIGILDKKKIQHWILKGGQCASTRDRNFRNFRDSKTGVLLIQFSAGKHGLSFNNCNKVLFFGLEDNAESFEQGSDRIHGINRGIEGKDAEYYIIMGVGTITEAIYKSIQKKVDVQKGVMNWIRGER